MAKGSTTTSIGAGKTDIAIVPLTWKAESMKEMVKVLAIVKITKAQGNEL